MKPGAIKFPGGKFILWACKHAEDQKHACTYVLCNECKEVEESKQGRSRRKRGALATMAAWEHDVFSLVILYTKCIFVSFYWLLVKCFFTCFKMSFFLFIYRIFCKRFMSLQKSL